MIIELLLVSLASNCMRCTTDYMEALSQGVDNKAYIEKDYIVCKNIKRIEKGFNILKYKGKIFETCDINELEYLGSCSSLVKQINKVCKR